MKTRLRLIRHYLIIIANVIIIIALFLGVSFYSTNNKNYNLKIQKQLFDNSTYTSQETISTLLKREQQLVNSWANFINVSNLTMDEAFLYLQRTVDENSFGVHIIYEDTYSGYTTKPSAATPDTYTVEYDKGYINSSDITVPEYIIYHASIESDKVNMLPSFKDKVTSRNVIGFCQKVSLKDGNSNKDAIVIRLILVSELSNIWGLYSNYEGSYYAMIDTSGVYVIRPKEMKGSSFYEYIHSLDKENYSPEDVQKIVTSSNNGNFTSVNSNTNNEIYYSWSIIEEGNDNIILINAIDVNNFTYSSKNENTLAIIVAIASLLLIIVNLIYFIVQSRGERRLRFTLEDQLTTISKQEVLLRDALDSSLQANRAKTVFLNNMSHDIRTPMNAIIGFTTLAASNIDDKDKLNSYLSKIQTSSNHLLSLINEVLDMSRIESGKVMLDSKENHLPDIIHDLRTIVLSNIKAKKQEFFIDTIDVIHEDVIVDRVRLNQVLLNLLSNAMKFTDEGGIISFRIFEKPSNLKGFSTYEFHVKDNGIGMSKEFKEHIFETFTRENSSTVNNIQGTGLGMAISKNIVEMMHGTIMVESEKGKGSEFIVSIPLKTCDIKQTSTELEKLKDLKALIADDDSNTAISISSMLTSIGMRVDWTLSGKEALIRTKAALESCDEYNAYIIDYLMPDMNGIETVREIRKIIGDSTPIIILTAYDWTEIEKEAREAGVTTFISKPLFMSDLKEALITNNINKENPTTRIIASNTFEGKKILLVEDNEFNREIAVELLNSASAIVDSVSDGSYAVEKIKDMKVKYDLVLMDIQMPIMNGYEATKAIRKLPTDYAKSIPIIAMTANAFEEDKNAAIEAGMNGHLAKPIDIELLMETLSSIFNNDKKL